MYRTKNEREDEFPAPVPDDFPEQKNAGSETPPDSVAQLGSVVTRRGDRVIYAMSVIGQIEGHYTLPASSKTTKYEHLIPTLLAVDEDEHIDGLLVLLNTAGGDVEAGLAIAEMIAGMRKPSVSLVIGGGHSIGIPLAVSADRSFIVKSASMTVHPVRTTGLTVGAPQTFEYFRRMQERITGFVVEHSSISFDDYSMLLLNTEELTTDIGTILSGEDAVSAGLIDAVGSLHEAVDALYDLIEQQQKKE